MPESDLTATELAAAVSALDRCVRHRQVEDVSAFDGRDDLQLVTAGPSRDGRVRILVALGRGRARVSTTRRRFPRAAFASGPGVDNLRRVLVGRTIEGADAVPGDRAFAVRFDGGVRLHFELYGARGLWALVDQGGVVLDLARPVATTRRTLRRGSVWQVHPPGAPPDDPPPRFAGEGLALLEAIDRHFAPLDLAREADADRRLLDRAAAKLERRLIHQRAGMAQRLAAARDAPALRQRADWMLAYAHTVRRGADSMEICDDAGQPQVLALDPSRPVPEQAKALYARARKLTDGAAETRVRMEDYARQLEELESCAADPDRLRELLARRGLVPTQSQGADTGSRTRREGKRTPQRRDSRDGFRRFVSVEGYPILCGRNNKENDRLSIRVARGNDLWLHIGRQQAGSHVVVRIPKGKTASLETLLDAGHVAVHFSKARGAAVAEVVYTQAKHVRKPKGLPPGAVLPGQTKSLSVRIDEDRLRRVLDSGAAD